MLSLDQVKNDIRSLTLENAYYEKTILNLAKDCEEYNSKLSINKEVFTSLIEYAEKIMLQHTESFMKNESKIEELKKMM